MARGSKTDIRVPAGFTRKQTYHGIEEYELTKNGLRVLYRYDDTAPVVGLMVTYLVGSRHEAVGYTGATHLLEHLMFRGSKRFPPRNGKSVIDALEEKGAKMNASTWLDRTNYYEVLPSEHFEYAITLEADRMRNAILTEKDRAEEMPAVRSEYAMRVENSPEAFLDEKIWAMAFMAHPYHHPTIGWQDDFEKVSIERLKHFYDAYYWPNNAVVTIVGNVECATALSLVRTHFGAHPRAPHPIQAPYTQEPPQTGKRSVEVCRPGTKNLLGMAYKVPEGTHADIPALLMLSAILAGGTTSRLHRALVEARLCASVESMTVPLHDPALMQYYATLADGVTHARVERVMMREYERVKQQGVTPDELARIRASLLTEMAFARDGHYATLSTLNEAIAMGDWRFFFDLPRAVAHLTPNHIQDVAQRYLRSDTLTVGYYRATNL